MFEYTHQNQNAHNYKLPACCSKVYCQRSMHNEPSLAMVAPLSHHVEARWGVTLGSVLDGGRFTLRSVLGASALSSVWEGRLGGSGDEGNMAGSGKMRGKVAIKVCNSCTCCSQPVCITSFPDALKSLQVVDCSRPGHLHTSLNEVAALHFLGAAPATSAPPSPPALSVPPPSLPPVPSAVHTGRHPPPPAPTHLTAPPPGLWSPFPHVPSARGVGAAEAVRAIQQAAAAFKGAGCSADGGGDAAIKGQPPGSKNPCFKHDANPRPHLPQLCPNIVTALDLFAHPTHTHDTNHQSCRSSGIGCRQRQHRQRPLQCLGDGSGYNEAGRVLCCLVMERLGDSLRQVRKTRSETCSCYRHEDESDADGATTHAGDASRHACGPRQLSTQPPVPLGHRIYLNQIVHAASHLCCMVHMLSIIMVRWS